MTPLRITAENIAWEWTSAEPDYERDWLSLADAIEKALSDLAPAITRQQHFERLCCPPLQSVAVV